MASPTALTLRDLRRLGYLAESVERWIPTANVRRDLFHVADVLAVHPRDRLVLLVQATTDGNVSARVSKATAQAELPALLRAGLAFEVWGWSRRDSGWTVRRVPIRLGDLGPMPVAVVPPRRRRRQAVRALFAGVW